MSASSIQYTVGADTSKGIANLKNFQSVAKDTGKQIQEAFGKKLTQIVSFIAIEQAIRRTGEWAEQIQQTSRALGVTAEQTQALQRIASTLGLNPTTTTDMFSNMESAAQDALNGNEKLLRSFNKLGVTMEDLRNKTHGNLWNEIMGKVPAELGSSDMFTRDSVQNIFKTPEQDVEAIKSNPKGTDLAANATGAVSNEDTALLAQEWANFKTDLSDLGNSMKPVVGLFISLADALVNALHALVDLGSGVKNLVMGPIRTVLGGFGGKDHWWNNILNSKGWAETKLGASKIGGVGAGVFTGLGKGMTGIADFVTGGGYHLTDKYTKRLGEITEDLKVNKDALTAMKHGEGLGQIAPLLLTEGSSALIRGAGTTAFNAGAKLESMGLPSLGLQRAGLATDVAGYKLAKSLSTSSVINGKEVSDLVAAENLKKILNDPAISSSLTPAQKASSVVRLSELQRKIANNAAVELAVLRTVGPAGAALTSGSAYGKGLAATGKQAIDGTQIYDPFAPQFAMKSLGASKNVNIGGMFGSGTNQIIRLNQKMVELLTIIQYNTSPTSTGGYGRTNVIGGTMGNTGNAAGQ
jgi:hypothetical protein